MQRKCWHRVVVGLLVAGVMSTLGACNRVSKTDYDAAVNAERELRERNAALEQALREKEARLAEVEQRAASRDAGNWEGGSAGRAPRDSSPQRDVVIELAGDVLFDSGQATIKSSAKTRLNEIAQQLNGKYAGRNVRLVGHTDSDPIKKSKWGTNEALSQARAQAVMDYLASRGVSTARMGAQGRGSAEPKGSKAASRRVEVVILGAR